MSNSRRGRRGALALLAVCGAIYPFVIYFGLHVLPPWALAAPLLVIAGGRLLLARGSKPFLLASALTAAALIALVAFSPLEAVRLYPVVVSLALAIVFAASLIFPPSVIEQIARLREPDLPAAGIAYTRKVTILWLGFFLANAAVSAWTAAQETLDLWTFYNGFLAYVLIALLFLGEFAVRQRVRGRQ